MAGDYRFGGMTNDQMANYLGISVPELQMIQEVMQGDAISPGSIEQAQKFAGDTGGGPMGGANRLDNILRGIANIQQHPLGSKHHGFNPTDILANFATGGLYGLGKGLASGDPMQIGAALSNPTSPGGTAQINTELRGPTSTLIGSGATLATAGLAGAFGSGGGIFVPENAVSGIDPATGNPAYMIKSAEGISYIPMGEATPGAFYTGPVTGALAGSGDLSGPATGNIGPSGTAGGSGLSETAFGLAAANQLGNMLTPQGGGTPAPGPMAMPPAQAGTQQQPRPGGSPSGSEMDTPGAGFIDPAYIKRQKGGKNSRGISDQGDLSQQQNDAKFAALYGFSGGM